MSFIHNHLTRRLGIVLTIIFVLIPILFIVIYVRSDSADNSELYNAEEPFVTLSGSVIFEEADPQAGYDAGVLAEDNPTAGELYAPDTATNGEYEANEEDDSEITGIAYLTFDDGPHLTFTPAILDILAEEDVKATFFTLPYINGRDVFWRIIDEGHEIGNHSHSHDYPILYNGTVSAFSEDILRARRFIENNFGYTTTSFRFPGGSQDQVARIRNPRIDAVRDMGYRYFDWDIDTNDWRRASTPESIIEDVLSNTNRRSHVIILMHDTYERTVEALPGLIAGLREQGYIFDIIRNHP